MGRAKEQVAVLYETAPGNNTWVLCEERFASKDVARRWVRNALAVDGRHRIVGLKGEPFVIEVTERRTLVEAPDDDATE